VPRRLGRLWRSGARRAQVTEAPSPELEAPSAGPEIPEASDERGDIGRRIEEARRRLRETIPPQEDLDRPAT
jgi:hypothetical protein